MTITQTVSPKKGDVEGNGVVNLLDYILLVEHYGTKTGDAHFDPRADFAGASSGGPDGKINTRDYAVLFEYFGT